MYGCVILPISITTSVLKLKKMSRQKVVQCLIEGIIKLEPDGLWGFNSLCGSIYTTALLYPIDSWASVLEIWLHHGLVCVIIASHNIGQRACPASAQTSSVMMAPSSCSYMSTPLNLISHSFPRRDLEISKEKVRHKTCWLMFLWKCFQH